MKHVLTIAAAMCTLVGAAWAQSSSPVSYLSLGVGVFELESEEVTIPVFGDQTLNEVDLGVGAYALLGRRLKDSPLAFEAELGAYTVGWDGFSDGSISFTCPPEDDCLKQVIRTVSFTGNVVLSAPMTWPIRPYGGVGAGFMFTDYNIDDVDVDTGFGYIGKVGADAAIAPGNRVGIQYNYLGAPKVEFDDGFAEFEVSGNTILIQWTAIF